MKRKLNVKNLILLIIMIGCLGVMAYDFVSLMINSFNGCISCFTWQGFIFDIILFVIALLIEDILFGDE